MEKIQLQQDVSIIGFPIKKFPEEIVAGFNLLTEKLGAGTDRGYYGVSYMQDGEISYWVMAEEKQEREAEKYSLTRIILTKGDYHSVTIHGWRNKTDSVKEVFHLMMRELHSPEGTHCIEWYKTDEEMICMIRQ